MTITSRFLNLMPSLLFLKLTYSLQKLSQYYYITKLYSSFGAKTKIPKMQHLLPLLYKKRNSFPT